MSSQKRLSRAYEQAKVISFDNSSKFILFSDCHRGENSFADEFANNRNIYFHALRYYFNHGFQYCELGDGDELWENLSFEPLFEAHKNVYMLMKRFHEENRLHLVYGNHDMVYKDQEYVKKHLKTYYDPKDEKEAILFENLKFHEALLLRHKET
ncbi:MAG: serine/threonine protein phosphatase, partial [Flavobacteriaceae bacterium]